MSNRIDRLDSSVQTVARSAQTLWANQKELTKSQNLLDEQFAVSTRMCIMGLNLLLEKVGADERVDGEDVEKLFRDWAEFRSRPDFRDLMMEWMLGVALDKMPPPPEQEAKENAEIDKGNPVVGEGVSEDSVDVKKADVSEVQHEDRAAG